MLRVGDGGSVAAKPPEAPKGRQCFLHQCQSFTAHQNKFGRLLTPSPGPFSPTCRWHRKWQVGVQNVWTATAITTRRVVPCAHSAISRGYTPSSAPKPPPQSGGLSKPPIVTPAPALAARPVSSHWPFVMRSDQKYWFALLPESLDRLVGYRDPFCALEQATKPPPRQARYKDISTSAFFMSVSNPISIETSKHSSILPTKPVCTVCVLFRGPLSPRATISEPNYYSHLLHFLAAS